MNLLWFEWPRCRDGYTSEIFHMDDLVYGAGTRMVSEIKYCAQKSTQRLVQLALEAELPLSYFVSAADSRTEELFIAVRSNRVIRERPLDKYPALFRDFAGLGLDKEAVTAFAARHGLLTRTGGFEQVNLWYQEIKRMRDGVDLFGRGQELADLSEWMDMFNQLALGSWAGHETLRISFHKTNDPAAPGLYLTPSSLLASMWLQFAQTVANKSRLRRCGHCGKWFPYGSGTGKRRSGHYCSSQCQQARWYQDHKAKESTE